MTFRHGLFTSESSPSVDSPLTITAGLTVAIGTAAVHQVTDIPLNKPILVQDMSEAKAKLGYSTDYTKFTLSEVMDTHFELYGVGPVVFINVLDPARHNTAEKATVTVKNKQAIITREGVLPDTLVVKLSSGASSNLVKGTDYTVALNSSGRLVISAVTGGGIAPATTSLYVSYSYADPNKVTDLDVIGAIDADTGKATGMELINSVFPLYRMIPGILIAPRYSKSPTVAAVLKAKSQNINGLFKAVSYTDLDTSVANVYSKVDSYKNTNLLSDPFMYGLWGDIKYDGKIYQFSSHAAALTALVDQANDDLPYVSPSNKALAADALMVNGEEIALGHDQATFLNANGISTAVNFIGGWRLWGNRTTAYPDLEEVKDTFLPLRRMFNYIENYLILNFWDKVDNATNSRLIDDFIEDSNVWLNGLYAIGAILGARVQFRKGENPVANLLNGKVRLHLSFASPTPAEDIEFIVEFDSSYFSRLF